MLMDHTSKSSTVPENTAVLEGSVQWSTFVSSLKEKGYFKGELEGSKGHQLLMATAREYFMQQNLKTESEKDDTKESR